MPSKIIFLNLDYKSLEFQRNLEHFKFGSFFTVRHDKASLIIVHEGLRELRER